MDVSTCELDPYKSQRVPSCDCYLNTKNHVCENIFKADIFLSLVLMDCLQQYWQTGWGLLAQSCAMDTTSLITANALSKGTLSI